MSTLGIHLELAKTRELACVVLCIVGQKIGGVGHTAKGTVVRLFFC